MTICWHADSSRRLTTGEADIGNPGRAGIQSSMQNFNVVCKETSKRLACPGFPGWNKMCQISINTLQLPPLEGGDVVQGEWEFVHCAQGMSSLLGAIGYSNWIYVLVWQNIHSFFSGLEEVRSFCKEQGNFCLYECEAHTKETSKEFLMIAWTVYIDLSWK